MARRRDQDLLDSVGHRIQRLRTERGLTQRQLAEAVSLEPESISRAEAGAISLSLTSLAGVASGLDVPLADLFDTARPSPPTAPAAELELLRLFRGLDPVLQQAALGAVQGIARTRRTS